MNMNKNCAQAKTVGPGTQECPFLHVWGPRFNAQHHREIICTVSILYRISLTGNGTWQEVWFFPPLLKSRYSLRRQKWENHEFEPRLNYRTIRSPPPSQNQSHQDGSKDRSTCCTSLTTWAWPPEPKTKQEVNSWPHSAALCPLFTRQGMHTMYKCPHTCMRINIQNP